MRDEDPEQWFKKLSFGQKVLLAPVLIFAFFVPDAAIRIIGHLFHFR
jgi:hypothetical protein